MGKVLSLILCSFLFCEAFLEAASTTDLQDLKKQAAQKEQEVARYKKKQQRLESELKKLTKKEQSTEQLVSQLTGDIEEVKSNVSKLNSQKEVIQNTLPMWQRLLKEEITSAVIENILKSSYITDTTITRNVILIAILKTDIMFFSKINTDLSLSEEQLAVARVKRKELLDEHLRLKKEQENLETNHKLKEKDLKDTKDSYVLADKDLKELKKSATQLEKLLKKAESQRIAAAKKVGGSQETKLDIPKNSLPWPISGQVISKFGKEYNSHLKTWIFRDGIKIAASSGTPITAVEGGKIIYAGDFRSYGNILIVDHGGGFFTIYGFLKELRARLGQHVNQGQIIAFCGEDTQGLEMGSGKTALYFEIRSGTQAVDPLLWLETK